MPIEGKSLGEAVQRLADHVNQLLAETITRSRLIVFSAEPPGRAPSRLHLGFRQGGRLVGAQLRTRFGPLRLVVRGTYESTMTDAGTHRLEVIAYAYTLTPEGAPEPLLRWEYVGQPTDPLAAWCRHHLQGPIPLALADRFGQVARLNDLHLPTGPVPIEEILRFCIVDLGVRPLSDRWQAALEASHHVTR